MRTPARGTRAVPLEPLRAGAELEDATDREQIFELLLRATRARLGCAALLTVEHDVLRGWRVMADLRFDVTGVETLQLPRNIPAIEGMLATLSPGIAALGTGEEFVDGLVQLIGGAAPKTLLMPVCVRMHPLAIIVAHDGEEPFGYEDVADLFPLLDAADTALARVLSTRARSAAQRAPTRLPTEDVIELGPADLRKKRRASTEAHREAKDWGELAEGIRELVRDGVDYGEPSEDEQLELLLELGQIERDHLGRPEAAIEAWQSALAIDASDERVLDVLEQQYAKLERWGDCIELLDKRVALTEDDGPRIALLLNLATIARDKLNDPGRAAEAYERVVALEPGHKVASPELEALYRAREEWEPVAAQMLNRASRDNDPRASVDALAEVAVMYEHKVGDPRSAALIWLTIAKREPSRVGSLEQVARLAPAADAWDEILSEGRAVAEHTQANHPDPAAQLWELVGRWARDYAADRETAVVAWEAALRLIPETDDELGRRSELHAELAELHEASPAIATAHYEEALAGRPDDTAVLRALHRLYLKSEAWDRIATLLPRLIDALAPSAQVGVIVELYVELGAVFADRLNRPDDAATAYQDALALDPKHALARRSLAALYERTGQHEALLETSEAEADVLEPAERERRYADIATAWHDLGKLNRAVAVWTKLLAVAPASLTAHDGVARSLRAGEQWLDLTTALRARVRASPGGYDRQQLLELADVLEKRLDDTSGATAVFEEILAREPSDPAALDGLARLHDRAGRLRPALDTLAKLLELTTAAHGRADVLQRIGQVHLAARDAAAARTSLVQALALDKDNASAREAMARVYLQQGELVAAGEEMLRAARLFDQTRDVLRCLADAAWLYRHRVGDTEKARECLHRILELRPDNADAKQALAELHHDNQEWESLWPHLEDQVRKLELDSAMPATDKRDVYLKAARCAVELGKQRRALELYDHAQRVAPGPAVQIERAEALYRSQQLDAAVLSLQTLAMESTGLDRAQRIAVQRRLAQIHTELGKGLLAQQAHGKVLDLDPTNRDTRAELTELLLAAGKYDDAISHLRELASSGAPVADRVALLERIGDLYRHQLSNNARATSTYLDGLDLDPGNRRLLQRLLELQSETGQWTRAVETIAKFLAHEKDPVHRAAYHLAGSAIRRSELRDPVGAREDFETALDELWSEVPLRPATRKRGIEVFQQLDTLLTEERDWKYLEQAYRRMIKRVPAGEPVLLPLWHSLGEHYRSRMDLIQSAIQAFEVAHALDPDKTPSRTKVLADLYARIGAIEPAQATQAAAKLVEIDPANPGVYRALAQASLVANRLDEAWCACRALVVLKHATFDEEMVYKKFQPHEVRKAAGVLDEDTWAHVRHPDEDRVISSIFALVWEPLVALRAGTAKSFDLKAKDRVPIEDTTRVVSRIFRHAARVLGTALPDVYAQPRRPGSLLLANTIEQGRVVPAVIVGRDLMTGYRDTELAAAIGAMVSLLRPAYYLELAMSTNEELEAAVSAAALLVGRTIGRTELEPLTSVFAPAIKAHLTRPVGETLKALVERLPDKLDLARWRASVEAASHRAGLLVAGELVASARMVALAGSRPTQRVHELIAYSASPGYFAVRQHLGVAIKK